MAQASRYGDTPRGSADDVFQSFPDYESGRRAQRDLWKTKFYQDRTVRAAIKKWSPDATEAHVNEMLAAANASNGEKLMREVSDTELNALMDVQQKWEGWHPGAMHGPPVDDRGPSRAFRLNNPGNIKRTDTMRQDPTPPTSPVNAGSPDTPSGSVNMVYAGTDKELLDLFGEDGSEGARSVPLRHRESAIADGWMIESVTVDPIEPINWREHGRHAMQTAGIDSPENILNTIAESAPTAGAIIGGGATGGWGAIPGYAAGQGARELIQNRSNILPGIADVAGHITSSADSPGPFIQNRPDIHRRYMGGATYSGVPVGVTEDPYAERTFPSPRQAAWDAFTGGVMGDIVNLIPGVRRGRHALQSLDEGNPWTAGAQGVMAALDAASGFGGGVIAQGIKATPTWQNLLAAATGGTGSAVGGELAGHAGEDWLDLTPDQQYALSALGEFGLGGVAGGLTHPVSSRVMGDIVTHPAVAATGAGLAASSLSPQAAFGASTLAYVAAAGARRRARDAATAESRAIRNEGITAARDLTKRENQLQDQATKRENQLQDQARDDAIRAEKSAIAAERAVTRDAQWDATGRARIAAAKTIAEAREAQQAHNRQAALDRTLNAETAAALRARAAAETRAREQEIRAANRAEDRAERATTRIESRDERAATRIESRRIADENRAEAMRVAAGRAEVADAHWAEMQRERIANAQTRAELQRAILEFKREVRADRNATNARKEQYQKIADETARARERELMEGLEARDPEVVVRSSVTDEGVRSTTTQKFGPASEESGGGIGESGIVDAGDVRTRPESTRRGDPDPQESTSPASATPDLSEGDAILADAYDRALGVSESINVAEMIAGKRYEELLTKEGTGGVLSEAEFRELDMLKRQFRYMQSEMGRRFGVTGSPATRSQSNPDRQNYGGRRRR